MVDRDAVIDLARRMAAAIKGRDQTAVRALLARDFVQRAIGGAAASADEFLAAVAQIPGEILSVDLEHLEVELTDAGALVTGIQHGRVLLDGKVVDDRQPFVDWMIKEAGEWRFRAAIGLTS
jgi:Domain of unknown function (DUF4440)